MIARNLIAVGLMLGIMPWIATPTGAAESPKTRRFERADKNDDGRVGPKERAMERKLEKDRLDKDNDGVVEPKEVREARIAAYLKNRSDVNTKWETFADVNKDGKVSPAELRAFHLSVLDRDGDGKIDAAERRQFWLLHKIKVLTDIQRKYDVNADSWLTGDELREYLKDRLLVIRTDGKAIVNTDIERQFDSNGDGVLDPEEAKLLKETVGD